MVPAGIVTVPFQQHPRQGQGRETLHTPKGQSLQVGELLWPTSDQSHSRNSVYSVGDCVFYNSAIRVPVVSVPVHLAAFSGDRRFGDVLQMPSELASAESGKWPERYEYGGCRSWSLERMCLSPEACLFTPGHAECSVGPWISRRQRPSVY